MIKVLTMNIMGYEDRFGPWPARQGIIRETIENEGPDIIALQAVRMDPRVYEGMDQAHQIAGLFPDISQAYFQPATYYAEGVVDGTALLACLPMSEVEALPLTLLPGSEDIHTRMLLHARFDLASGPLHLFNAYFSWVSEQSRRNIEEAVGFLGRFDGPGLLVGDFNTGPDAEALDPLRQAGWTDLWARFHPEEDGFTFFEGASLLKRIDYAWANPALLGAARDVRMVAEEEAAVNLRPSDHAGLLVSLDLNP